MPKSSNDIFARAEQCRMPYNQPGQAENTDVKIEMKCAQPGVAVRRYYTSSVGEII